MEGKAGARWQGASHLAATSTLTVDHHTIQVITDNWVFLKSVPLYSNKALDL